MGSTREKIHLRFYYCWFTILSDIISNIVVNNVSVMGVLSKCFREINCVLVYNTCNFRNKKCSQHTLLQKGLDKKERSFTYKYSVHDLKISRNLT